MSRRDEYAGLHSRIDNLLDAQLRLLVRAEVQRALYEQSERDDIEQGREMAVSVMVNGEEWRGVLYPVDQQGRRA